MKETIIPIIGSQSESARQHEHGLERVLVALLAMLLLLCVAGAAVAELTEFTRNKVWLNEETFPDVNFRAWLQSNCTVNTNYTDDQGVSHITEPFIYVDSVEEINCSNMKITSLQGVENFTSLTLLTCFDNQLTSLDVSNLTSLISLNCYRNQLTTLNVSGLTSLEHLNCFVNQLTELDVMGLTSLTYLNCFDNQLVSLDVSDLTSLTYLNCYVNQLATLDASGLTELMDLRCYENQLALLDVSGLTSLQTLHCNDNQLASLDVSTLTSLTDLNCSVNQLTKLDVSGLASLQKLRCYDNQLATLDVNDACELVFDEDSGLFSDIFRQVLPDTLLGTMSANGGYQYCLADIPALTIANMTRVTVNDCTSFDAATGVATFASEPTEITYQYDVFPGEKTAYMDVTAKVGMPPNPDVINGRKVAWLNEETFPDANFRACLQSSCAINTSYTDDQSVSHTTGPFIYVDSVTRIACLFKDIASLQGVEKFTSLTNLDCDGNQLTSLDVSSLTSLTSLSCNSNQLTSLDVSALTSLTSLYCGGNQLISLDVSDLTSLTTLYCHYNQLTMLTVNDACALDSIKLSHQTLPAPIPGSKAADGTYQYSLAGFSGLTLADMARITVENCVSFDVATGIATFSSEPTEITYQYDVFPGEKAGYMSVTVNTAPQHPTPEITAIATDNAANKVGVTANTVYCFAKGELADAEGNTTAYLYRVSEDERVLIGKARVDENCSIAGETVFAVDWDITGLADGDYEVIYAVTDIHGQTTERAATLNVDHRVPAQIINVVAAGDLTVIRVSWSISSELGTSYRLYRRAESESVFELVADLPNRDTLSYTDGAVQPDLIYNYCVVSVNNFGQEGEPSIIAAATLRKDTEAPIVTKLTPANGSYLARAVDLRLYAQDDVAVTSALLELSLDNQQTWTELAHGASGTLDCKLETATFPDGPLLVRGKAWDAAGNESAALVYAYCVDNTAPEKVTGLSYESTSVTLTLKWENVEAEDVAGFNVERKNGDGSFALVATVRNTLGVNLRGLTPDTAYTYRVAAFDQRGNIGPYSDELTALTQLDTTAPVVVTLRPAPGYYSENIPISATVTDDYSVAAITLQASFGTADAWKEIVTQTYDSASASRTLAYTLSLADYKEGALYVRAVARDTAGNESTSGTDAPFVQYVIDRTAPAAPEGVGAVGRNGSVEVYWAQGAEDDLGRYSVYRAASAEGNYVLLAGSLASLNYVDRTVEDDTTYYYKLAVSDTAGNRSALSQAVSARPLPDTVAPVILGVFPVDGSSVGPSYRIVTATASDNRALDALWMEYALNEGDWQSLLRAEGIRALGRTLSAPLPLDKLGDGAVIHVRVSASDRARNACVPVTLTYTVDLKSPAIVTTSAAYSTEEAGVIVAWTGCDESDLVGYRVYRRAGATGNFTLVAQRKAVAGQTDYTCTDYTLPIEAGSYRYKVEAVDICGNVASLLTPAVEVADRSVPTAALSCESVWEVGVEYLVNASASSSNKGIATYHIDFGDGVASESAIVVHTYAQTGTYLVTLTVTDADGSQASCARTVSVRERSALGQAVIRVVDSDGVPVPGASVYFDLGEEAQTIKTTDRNGYATFTAAAGRHAVGCIIPNNEWLPARKDLIVTANATTSVSLTMVHHPLIGGCFEVKRMTFEEIVKAGIDVSAPENQHYLQIHVTLTYGTDNATDEVETTFHYNPITGVSDARPVVYDTPDGQKRHVIISGICPSGGNIKSGEGGDYVPSESDISIAYLDIPVGVSMLKEFFDVQLHIINNASQEFSMLDNIISLNIPDGLSIVRSYASESEPVVSIAEIKGQTKDTITWILRGDKVGSYYLSADYSGILSQFREVIRTRFLAEDPIEVYGTENLRLTLEVPEELDHGTFYYNVSISNDGRTDVFCPSVETGDELLRADLFDAAGAKKAENLQYSADALEKFKVGITLSSDPDTLEVGGRLTKHYMSVEQTQYTDNALKLKTDKLTEYAEELRNTYGLEVEIFVKPLSYFKSFLGIGVDPDMLDQSAYQQLMTNENYAYWNMYASTGAVHSSLTTNGQEMFWNLMKLVGGKGGLAELFGAEDEKQVQTIILDAMELNASADDYSEYKTTLKWLKKIRSVIKTLHLDESWKDYLSRNEYEVETKTLLIQTLDLTIEKYSQEFWATVRTDDSPTGIYEFFVEKMQMTAYYQESLMLMETTEVKETVCSQVVRSMFTADGFEKVWEFMGNSLSVAENIVEACEDASLDIGIYVEAQAQLGRCETFLNALIEYPASSADGRLVRRCAERLMDKIREMNAIGSFTRAFLEKEAWAIAEHARKEILKRLNLTPSTMVKALKKGLKLVTSIGDSIFNVTERHEIADNIRFVSIMSASLCNAIPAAKATYDQNKTGEAAQTYMSLISSLINLRAIGESQAAHFGVTYEVLPLLGVFDSEELFYAVREITIANCDHDQATSWQTWRDYVEDRISRLRLKLLSKQGMSSGGSFTTPVVTFDYATSQTAQSFSGEYEYRLGGSGPWTVCDDGAIHVEQPVGTAVLLVRRVDISNTSEKLTAAVFIHGAASLDSSGIIAHSIEGGYRIENLDHLREYTVAFSEEPMTYLYEDQLALSVPAGSYSYEMMTDAPYRYAYVRSVADAAGYASYILVLELADEEPAQGENVVSGRKVAWLNEETFPDANFRAWLQSNCTVNNGYYDSQSVWHETAPFIYADSVASISCSRCEIASLEGVKEFTNLETLLCDSNLLTELDVSGLTSLAYLRCDDNQLVSIDLSGLTGLDSLRCNFNRLTMLEVDDDCALSTDSLLSPQSAPDRLLGAELDDGTYEYCLAGLGGLTFENMARVTVNDCASFDVTTGIATFDTEPTEITYQYDVFPGEKTLLMAVIVEAKVKTAPDYLNGCEIAWLNEETFPDVTFRAWLQSNCTVNTSYTDDQGVSHTTEPFIYVDSVTEIDCSLQDIASLQGVEKFTSLTNLSCNDNKLASLDVSGLTSLAELHCDGNQLASLDVSELASLKNLSCGNNSLTSLDVSGLTSLTSLSCSINQLTSLDVSGLTSLTSLFCYGNQLTSLDVSALTSLTRLDCSINQLTSLDVSGLTSMMGLSCYSNQLTTLDMSGLTSLTFLNCNRNQLTSLDVSGLTSLTSLHCIYNRLTSLDVFGLTSLTYLDCSSNQLTMLTANDACEFDFIAFSPQTLPTPIPCSKAANGTYQYSLAGFGGLTLADMERITVDDCASFDVVTGIATFASEPTEITYQYDVFPGEKTEYMSVTAKTTAQTAPDPDVINGRKVVWLNEGTFPDASFRAWISENLTVETEYADAQGVIYEVDPFIYIDSVTSINCADCGIASLAGVEKFTCLTSLYCLDNQLTVLDVSALTDLDELACNNNQLTALSVAGLPKLTYLCCSNNQLTEMDLTGLLSLKVLHCDRNWLTELDVVNLTSLTWIDCGNNQLTALDVSGKINLIALNCSDNQLSSLNVANLAKLKQLGCSGNHLPTLTVNDACEFVWNDFAYYQSLDDIATGVKMDDGTYQYNLAGLQGLALADRTRVTVSGCVSFDPSTGVATFAQERTVIGYQFDIFPGEKVEWLLVNVPTYTDTSETVLQLPSSLTTIGSRAFEGCAADAVAIPASVMTIAEDAFADTSLTLYVRYGSYAKRYATDMGMAYVVDWR